MAVSPSSHTLSSIFGFTNVYHFACVWPKALKLGCITNFDMLFLVSIRIRSVSFEKLPESLNTSEIYYVTSNLFWTFLFGIATHKISFYCYAHVIFPLLLNH